MAKQKDLGFEASHTIKEAVEDLCKAFDQGSIPDSLENERYYNIKRMQNLSLF